LSFKKKIIYLFCVLLFLFIIAETSSRIFLHYYFSRKEATVSNEKLNEYGELIKRPAPYVVYKFPKNYKGKYVSTNSLGFRGEEFSVEKHPNKKRVIILGGSTAFGFLAGRNDKTISGFLERKFNSENIENYEFYNMAIQAYITTQELVLLTVEVLDYKPDIVIFLNGINDLYSSDISRPAVYSAQEKLYNDLIDNNLFSPALSYLTVYLESKSKFYYLLNWWIKRKLSYETPPDEKNKIRSIENYTNNLVKMNKICETFGIKSYFFFQPLLTENSKKKLFPKEILILNKYKKIDEKAYDKLFNEAYKTAVENNFIIYDLRNVFYDVNKQIYYDFCHFNDTGNLIVAEYMYKVIKDGVKD
jgi:hypothetical protein